MSRQTNFISSSITVVNTDQKIFSIEIIAGRSIYRFLYTKLFAPFYRSIFCYFALPAERATQAAQARTREPDALAIDGSNNADSSPKPTAVY